VDHSRAGKPFGTQALQQGPRQGRVMKSVGLAQEDPDQELIAVKNSH
jgi:hypothetical protein